MLNSKSWILISVCIASTFISDGQDRTIKSLSEKIHDQRMSALQKSITEDFVVQRYELQTYGTPQVSILEYKEHEVPTSPTLSENEYPSQYIPTTRVAIESKKPIAFVSCNTYRKSGGKYYKLDEIKYNVVETQGAVSYKTTGDRVYAAQSVLSSGQWYQIAIPEDGLYKIDYDFLTQSMGLQTGNIDARSIQLYGNGGQMLSWNNAIIPHDDLQEIPVKLMDGGDGKINPGDKILFFASGPDTRRWDYSSDRYTHIRNKYEDRSYVYVRIGQANSKRISNNNISTYDKTSDLVYQHIYREKDSVILDIVGGYWLGDAIGGSNTQRSWSFGIQSPHMDSSLRLNAILAYHSTTNAGSISLSADGTSIFQSMFSAHGTDFSDPVVSTRGVDVSLANRSSISINMQMSSGSFSDRGFLKSLDLTIPSRIDVSAGTPFLFGDARSAADATAVRYTVTGSTSGLEVWDVSDLHDVQRLSIQPGHFVANTDSASRMILINPTTDGRSPEYIGQVENQNLHAHSATDLVIVTHPDFRAQADELAAYRNAHGVSTQVVDIRDIYREFSSGSQDPVAIRDYMKMLYDRTSASDVPHNLLLMGDASFDFKNRIHESDNTNYIPTIETEHIVRINSFNTDDYFAVLDDHEDPTALEPMALDIGVGRIPCKSAQEAALVIAKIKHYESPACFGDWKLRNVYLADNADPGRAAHMLDAEQISDEVHSVNKLPNTLKSYGDAYKLVSSGGGSRLPDFNEQINTYINQGALIVNYNGHGGYKGLGQEGFMTLNDINSWQNPDNLPIFITATCDFSKFDFPDLESAGEKVLVNNENGGVALITTTQAVFRSANKVMNTDYLVDQFEMQAGRLPSTGEAWKVAKNEYFNGTPNIGSTYNYQKFALLGDPSMPPAFPKHQVVIDSITRLADGQIVDTLQARGRYTLHGHLVDFDGNLLTEYNGLLKPSIYDKPKSYKTVYQYPSVPIRQFEMRNSIVYKGNARVTNGQFSSNFILPKDIQYQYGTAKISTYAHNDAEDAAGANYDYILGGEDTSIADDTESPLLEAYLDDENFVNGGITSKDPILLLKLEDISGINTSGSSIGHDLVAVLDDDASSTYILNDYYTASPDDYTKGTVSYPLYNIQPGKHHIDVKVWDGANNSATGRLDFEVISQEELELRHVYNYPNPFSTSTNFMFEHNFPGEILNIKLNIYSISGKLIKTIKRQMTPTGTRIDDLHWDGRDNAGDKIGNGAYYYNLEVKTESGKSAKKLEKLYIIN